MAFNATDSSIFCLKSLLTCGDIQLSTWCQNGRTQLLALYLRRGEFVICLLTDQIPVIRRVPWYRDPVHQPVALALSPAGSFLLVLSQSCHLYTVPALPLLDPTYKTDMALNGSDVTIVPYPFKKEGYSDTFCKLKELSGKKPEKIGSALVWYQTLEDCQQIGIIGTDNGELILVDLVQGVKIASVSVRGTVLNLTVCHDNSLESVFLLVSTSVQQYKLILEQRTSWGSSSGKSHSRGGSSEEGDDEPPKNYRARLHGFKQMSVEKLASIKMKIAETRAKAQLKSGYFVVPDDTKAFLHAVPEPLDMPVRDTLVSLQYSRGRYVLSGYHQPSQLLTVHSTTLENNPLFVYKMPPDTVECLLSDRIIYVVNQERNQVSAVSSHLSESRIERDSEFNPECVLGTFDVNLSFSPKSGAFEESVIAIYQGFASSVPLNCPKEWKVDGLQKLLDEGGMAESCIVVTTNQIFRLGLTNHVVYSALRLILEHHALLLAERLCKIFGLNLSKILELAGDIDMVRLRFPAAIAHFKLASCGPLRITVKLAKLGHCTELLSYSSALLATPAANLTLADHIHISNLVLMAFVYQILNGGGAHFRRRFLSFLTTNDYYDKCIGMNLAGKSLLFSAVHKLMTQRGLIADGLAVLCVLVKNFNHDPDLEAAAEEDEDMWLCLSEPTLQEAFVYRKENFPVLTAFLNRHLSEMPETILTRVCKLYDPSTAALRPIVRLIPIPEDEESFPIDKLVQFFLTALLAKIGKNHLDYDRSLMLPYEELVKEDSPPRDLDGSESGDDAIWAIRKERRDSSSEYCQGRILSCGFSHTALIRNGNVIIWGMSNKGCLGRGPALPRSAQPEPLSWFTSFRLQVSQVSCGRAHTMAMTNNGVYAWGSSQFGQLGLQGVRESPYPRLIVSLTKHRIVSVVCGQYHTLCLASNGSVFGFGWNVHGQLGIGTVENATEPVLIQTLQEHVIVDITCGHGHSLVLTNSGHVYSFGSSIFGQLGTGAVHKSTLPILVRGIPGKVIKIATAYFHNLALTSHNSIYSWGASPQVLRLQSQAHKRARAAKPAGVELSTADLSGSEAHLQPVLVDTRNVTGRIAQIACGCHHFALATDSGSLYTWGRSMDGQLGNGSRNEVVVPSLIQDGQLKVSALSLGCDFSVIVEKHSGRVFAWGSNGSGQIGVPIKETAAKATDGKVIIVKTVKRVVRLPNSVANLVDTPCEVPSIPSATFTYQPLNSACAPPDTYANEAYNAAVWHKTIQKFFSLVNPDLLLCKCLELGNHQAASKILLLQGQTRQGLVHQLKALQRSQKMREKIVDKKQTENGQMQQRRRVQTPDAETHPFTVQGGIEEMCDLSDTQHLNGGKEGLKTFPTQSVDQYLAEYTNTAKEILLQFLTYSPDSAADILETGIQFWTAQKLPMSALEKFLLEHIERVYYPLGCLLYLSKRDLSKFFSAELQLRVTTRLVAHVEQNGNCGEFLAILSKLLSMDGETTVAGLSAKLQNPPKKNIHVTWPQCPGDSIYIFSCGHSKTSLPNDQNKLSEAYAKLETEGSIDMACPDCVCSVLSAEVA